MILTLFCIVYLGMVLGNLPGLALDRTGIALLAAIALIVFGKLTAPEIVDSISWSTIALLFGLMILSAQFYFSGFYSLLVQRLAKIEISPSVFLLCVILVTGLLSAALINDIVCLALTPLFIAICVNKGWKPLPFLLGLAAASNIGSAMTLIGNPQNILISETMHLSFTGYFLTAAIPSLLGLIWTWGVLCFQTKGRWLQEPLSKPFPSNSINRWQISKAIAILTIVLLLFFFTSLPRYQVALGAAGLILLSRKMASQTTLGFIDWQLLILFLGLFLVNGAFLKTGIAEHSVGWLQTHGLDLSSPIPLYLSSLILSNIVSNVPAVMLLLPFVHEPIQGSILALSSTYAGNLFLMGSIANLIVAAKAKEQGVEFSWKAHFKAGLPITVGTVLISAIWLYLQTV